jgi:pyrimidine operon attenuation protein/uracil phosphoribosyltransferase
MRQTVSFASWFDRSYRRPSESRSAAINRFAAEHSINIVTIFYALRGARVAASTAQKIERASSGKVTISALVTGLRRDDVRTRRVSP